MGPFEGNMSSTTRKSGEVTLSQSYKKSGSKLSTMKNQPLEKPILTGAREELFLRRSTLGREEIGKKTQAQTNSSPLLPY